MVVSVILFATHLSRPRMELLFSRMDYLQAQDLVSKLEEMNINYRLSDGGTSVLVPRDERDRLRLQLSPELYAQGAGFELFTGGGITVSDSERKVQWQLALQEELRRTITSVKAVDYARVHLVLPEPTVFLREKSNPSASILLGLSPLTTLTQQQVKGILFLVAGSVENLKPQDVSVVDSRGNVLYDAYFQDGGMVFDTEIETQMQLRARFERELEGRITSLLEHFLGQGSALVMVSAEMDFDFSEKTITSFDHEPVPRSHHRVEESYRGEGAPDVEVGESNIPGYTSPVYGSGEYTYDRTEETTNYEVGELREYVASAPGRISRLSTAVVIDENNETGSTVGQVSALVAHALGQNEARGDTLSVQLIPFDRVERDPMEIYLPDGFTLTLTHNIAGQAGGQTAQPGRFAGSGCPAYARAGSFH